MIGSTLYLLQEKLIFLSKSLAKNYVFTSDFPFEELFLKTDETTIINAIHFKNKKPKGVILYFHGNADNLKRWMKVSEFFVKKNYDVFVMDYRTYGKSTGILNETGFYTDAQFCYDYLLKKYSPDEITIYGRSLGTGIATYIASKNKAKQLILETPYFNIADIARHRFPFIPIEKLLKYKFPTNEFIVNVKSPITIFHGTSDRIVPYDSAKKLFEVAPKKLTKMITIKGGSHNNLLEYEEFQKAIDEIL